MRTYEAVFADGTIATFEADTMTINTGFITLERTGEDGGPTETVCIISASDLYFIRDTNYGVEITEGGDWDEEE